VNFGIVYGLTRRLVCRKQLGIDTRRGQAFHRRLLREVSAACGNSEIARIEQARRDQKVSTLFGRVRPIPDIHSKNFNLRGFAERTAVNTPLQGTAADLIKIAMIRIDRELRERNLASKMLLQVHDELVFEVPEDEIDSMKTLVREHMEHVHELKVPLQVDVGVGPNWRDLE
jgi:DNA polymerase-1